MTRHVFIFLLAASLSANCSGVERPVQGQDTELTVTSVTPSSGVTGDWTIISGNGFASDVYVTVGEKIADITLRTSSRMQITLPQNKAGSYPVAVHKGAKTVQGPKFTYTEDSGIPEDNHVADALRKADRISALSVQSAAVIAGGVEQTDVFFQTTAGTIVHAYIVEANLNVPGLKLSVCTPEGEMKYYQKKQTLTQMANFYDKPGERVVAMINGDFWDTGLLVPRGPIHHNGVVINKDFNYAEKVPQQALSYIAVRNDGTMLIDFKDSYPENKASLKEVTGSGVVLVKDGGIPTIKSTWTALDPRTAIGYTDRNIVYLLVADGRQDGFSNGLTYADMSSIFVSLGCSAAANLDGGGSAQILTRNPATGKREIRNRPSDGKERAVFNGWMVTVNEQ